MEKLKRLCSTAKRPELLALLAAAIGELTIRGRYYYDEPDALVRLRETNEAIHCVAGHLRDLADHNEVLTSSRLDGIFEQLRLLPPSRILNLYWNLARNSTDDRSH